MAPSSLVGRSPVPPGDRALARELAAAVEGEVLFDPYSRGRYSTDASIYQIEPVGVLVPRTAADVAAALEIARRHGVPLLPRGAGTSQCGQTVGEALVIDYSKHLRAVVALEPDARTVTVEPGIVLDDLNRALRPYGLFFPVDVSTASRATIGGMTGNNSCGARSVRYGNMVHNVRSIEGLLVDGTACRFEHVPGNLGAGSELAGDLGPPAYRALVAEVRRIAGREADEIGRRFPALLRRVGGYNLDMVSPSGHNMAHLLVGSEGTLSLFSRITLDLQPIPAHRVLGVCHFDSFYRAMDSVRHLVDLEPTAVELVDHTMIELARAIPLYAGTVARFVRGEPASLLLVEFAGEEREPLLERLAELGRRLAELGFPDAVVEATEPGLQSAIWEVRKAGLNIMMSMKGDGKPISFIEDCAVRLEDLAEYTHRLNDVFQRHGTEGTWYAHASVGCLHVRPVLNMKDEADVRKMRAIAEEAFAMVREYRGSHSGEHGDGLVRSEFHEPMFGPRVTGAFAAVKDAFDPQGLLNPGKIVRPPRMDDRTLFRYKPGYRTPALDTALDWSAWRGLAGAVEMCNNNGACRKSAGGVMCPSFRVTGDEQHLTRGRANTLRLALSGQLGPEGLTSDEMYDAMRLCVGCKACRRECPTGVDMARMKLEFLHHYRQRHGLGLGDRVVAYLPRYAPAVARFAAVANAAPRLPGARWLAEHWLGLSRARSLPRWQRDRLGDGPAAHASGGSAGGRRVVLLADTFSRWFEPDPVEAARRVLEAAGYRVQLAAPPPGRRDRPLCCGRTFLAAGLIDEARREAERCLAALVPLVERGAAVVGLEPACLLTLRDELGALLPGPGSEALAASAWLFEEFVSREIAAGRFRLDLRALPARTALVHGHCHQKAFGAMDAVTETLALVPDLDVEVVESSCCGMAGAFGYQADTHAASMRMAELSLLPAVRAAGPETLIVADGTSCRHQIRDGAGRSALHAAQLLEMALKPGRKTPQRKRGRR